MPTRCESVDTLRTLVDEFSTLARFPASQPRPASVNEIVDNALSMFNGRLDRIRVRTNLAPDLPSVLADSEAIKRAVANLVDNAAEAVRDSLVREIQISTSLVASRDAVELVIADTGHGVTQELKEKLFLPYFSTKKRGTGLGLAIVSRIIEDHRGSIGWRRTSRSGQTLHCRIACRCRSRKRTRRQLTMHKLLIVDDEPGIRESLTGILEDEGYQVESAASGDAAGSNSSARPLSTSYSWMSGFPAWTDWKPSSAFASLKIHRKS